MAADMDTYDGWLRSFGCTILNPDDLDVADSQCINRSVVAMHRHQLDAVAGHDQFAANEHGAAKERGPSLLGRLDDDSGCFTVIFRDRGIRATDLQSAMNRGMPFVFSQRADTVAPIGKWSEQVEW